MLCAYRHGAAHRGTPSLRVPFVLFLGSSLFLALYMYRPEAHNALSPAVIDGLVSHLHELKAEPDLRALFVRSAGPTFCAVSPIAGLVVITRAAVYPMKNSVYRLVATGLRLVIPLSLPGPRVTISSPTTFSSVATLAPLSSLSFPHPQPLLPPSLCLQTRAAEATHRLNHTCRAFRAVGYTSLGTLAVLRTLVALHYLSAYTRAALRPSPITYITWRPCTELSRECGLGQCGKQVEGPVRLLRSVWRMVWLFRCHCVSHSLDILSRHRVSLLYHRAAI